VTLRAFRLGVRTQQWEIGKARVVKCCVLPLVECMALLALHRQIGGDVVRTLWSLKITLVASDALCA
jgi:hypothetical protein